MGTGGEGMMAFRSAIRSLSFLLLLGSTDTSALGACRCNPPEKGETTHWVGNLVTVFAEKKGYRVLAGVVVRPDGKPLAEALVEVFTKPEYLLSEKTYAMGKPGQRRIAACRTNVDGKFCFSGLKSGKYELRSSSNGSPGWNVSQIYVVVDPEKGLTKGLRVKMTIGI